jgi:hypothetical protein
MTNTKYSNKLKSKSKSKKIKLVDNSNAAKKVTKQASQQVPHGFCYNYDYKCTDIKIFPSEINKAAASCGKKYAIKMIDYLSDFFNTIKKNGQSIVIYWLSNNIEDIKKNEYETEVKLYYLRNKQGTNNYTGNPNGWIFITLLCENNFKKFNKTLQIDWRTQDPFNERQIICSIDKHFKNLYQLSEDTNDPVFIKF